PPAPEDVAAGLPAAVAVAAGPLNPETPAPALNPETPAPALNPETPAPALNPETPAPALNPETPALPLNPETPALALNPETPALALNPETPAPKDVAAGPPAAEDVTAGPRSIFPAPLLNPETPAPLLNPETPAPLLNPETPAPLLNPETPAPLLNPENSAPEDVAAGPPAPEDAAAGPPAPEDVPAGPPAPEDVAAGPPAVPAVPPAPEEVPAGPPAPEEVPEGPPTPEEVPAGPPAPVEVPACPPAPVGDAPGPPAPQTPALTPVTPALTPVARAVHPKTYARPAAAQDVAAARPAPQFAAQPPFQFPVQPPFQFPVQPPFQFPVQPPVWTFNPHPMVSSICYPSPPTGSVFVPVSLCISLPVTVRVDVLVSPALSVPVPITVSVPVPMVIFVPVQSPFVPSPFVQSPVQSLFQSPVQSLFQSPVQSLVQSPVQSPLVQSPVQSPLVQSPVQSVVQSPVQSLFQSPVQSLFQSPVQSLFQSPVQSPVPSPAQSPVPSPAQSPVPSPARSSVPSPARSSVPSPARSSVPSPARSSVPSPARSSVPSPARSSVPSPIQFVPRFRLPENSTEGEYGDDYYDAGYDEVCNREAVIRFGSTVIPIFFTIVVLLSLIDESRFYLSTCDRRDRLWRRCGECYAACNIIQHDWFGGGSVKVWGGMLLEGLTDLHRLDNGTLTAIRHRDEILGPVVRPYAGAVGPGFLLVHNNARPYVARLEDLLSKKRIFQFDSSGIRSRSVVVVPGECISLLDSLVGNILVLVVLGLYKNLKSITNLFLLNLAVSDLIFTLGLPFWACYYIWSWTFGDFMCKAVNFVLYVGFYSSTVFLMLMTIQSYVAVVHPQSDWNRWRPVVFPILAWVVSFSAALPHLLLSEVIPDPTDPSQLYCEYGSVSALTEVTYEQNAFFVVAFVVISVCFIRLYQTISKSQTRKEHRTITLIFCVVLVF
ncbi:hypothetical protein NFI96_031916, partial [Prochilodus magdalenae]